VRFLIVSNRLIIALEVLEYGGSVVVEIWVGFFLEPFSLGVGLKSESQLLSTFIINKEVC